MKTVSFRGFGSGIFLLVLLIPSLSGVEKKKAVPLSTITKLAWLAGNWRVVSGGRVTEEQWMVPAGGMMLGMTRGVLKGRVLEYGLLQIREGPGGMLFYVLQPAGPKGATLQQTALTEDTVVFENQLAEFPQKISYTHRSDGAVQVVSEGLGADGQSKRVEYSYQRAQP